MKDALKWRNTLSQTRLSSIVSQPIKVVVHVDIIVVVVFNVVVVFVMVVVDPRTLPLEFKVKFGLAAAEALLPLSLCWLMHRGGVGKYAKSFSGQTKLRLC